MTKKKKFEVILTSSFLNCIKNCLDLKDIFTIFNLKERKLKKIKWWVEMIQYEKTINIYISITSEKYFILLLKYIEI